MTDFDCRDAFVKSSNPDYSDAALVTVMIGTNGGVSGSLADIPDEGIADLPYTVEGTTYTTVEEHLNRFGNTFYGNLGACIEWVKYKNKMTEIFIITPPRNNRANDGDDYRGAMSALRDMYAIRLLDAHAECGISGKNILWYTYDGTHMTDDGNALLGRYLGNAIRNS
jgi:lysophospholipase L1-like esterase